MELLSRLVGMDTLTMSLGLSEWLRTIFHLKIVQLLLEKKADIDAHGGYYNNSLKAAARAGHLDIFSD